MDFFVPSSTLSNVDLRKLFMVEIQLTLRGSGSPCYALSELLRVVHRTSLGRSCVVIATWRITNDRRLEVHADVKTDVRSPSGEVGGVSYPRRALFQVTIG